MRDKAEYAHRVSWILNNGRNIPKGKLVLHKCDVRSCVRPSHLFIGTHLENNRDTIKKGRDKNNVTCRNRNKKSCPRGHKYNKENTRIKKDGSRSCIKCERKRRMKNYYKSKYGTKNIPEELRSY